MEIVIIVIAVIVYIIAGIMLITNDSTPFFVKLLFAPVYVLLLVGVVITDLIGDIKEKQRMKDPEYAEEKRKCIEQNRKEEIIKKAHKQAALELKKKQENEALEKNIFFYEKSEATKKIIAYIQEKSNGVPYTIRIDTSIYPHLPFTKISFYFEGGWDEYDFEKFQILPLKMPDDEKIFPIGTPSVEIAEYFSSKWRGKNNTYYLACAINRYYNNVFCVEEEHIGIYTDCDWDNPFGRDVTAFTETTKTCTAGHFNATLTRAKRSF